MGALNSAYMLKAKACWYLSKSSLLLHWIFISFLHFGFFVFWWELLLRALYCNILFASCFALFLRLLGWITCVHLFYWRAIMFTCTRHAFSNFCFHPVSMLRYTLSQEGNRSSFGGVTVSVTHISPFRYKWRGEAVSFQPSPWAYEWLVLTDTSQGRTVRSGQKSPPSENWTTVCRNTKTIEWYHSTTRPDVEGGRK